MKKIFFQLIIYIFLFSLTNKPVYAKDFFTEIEALNIGDSIPTSLQQSAEIIENGNPNTTYLRFESSSVSYPHYVELDTISDIIIYIELKIPKSHLEIYQNYLSSLGTPETKDVKTQSVISLGYPSQGLSFITSNTSKNFIIFTRYPIKTIESFRSNEAKNFVPVSRISSSPPTSPPPKNVETNKINKNVIIIIITLITTIALTILFITKRRKITYTMNNEQPENPKEI